jgi:superfamily II DNA or RNA helicase
VITIAHNAVTAKLVNAPKEALLEAQRVLTYVVEGAEHSATFKAGTWDGRASFLDWNTQSFPRGFVYLVQGALQAKGFRTTLLRKPFPEPLGPAFPVVDEFGEDPRYDYQRQVPELVLKHGQVIAQVATGGGKSRIAKLCFARIMRPTLFLTTRGILMHQMAHSFSTLGHKVGIMGDGEFSAKKGINVGMVQTIAAHLAEPDPTDDPKKQAAQLKRRERMKSILAFFEFVILEEAHEASGNSYFDILRHCTNAHYRLALTGTPFMKDSEEANMRLMASSGPVAIRISEKMLIDRGILAKPYFKFIALAKTHEKLYKSTPWQRAYELGIVENEHRNRHIVAEVCRATQYGLSAMVLVQRQEHGKRLLEMFEKVGLNASYIFGEHDQQRRKSALQALAQGKLHVLIGSTILDVGVDVPAVGMIVLAGAGKAEVALRQRIGRGLREKKNGLPNVAFIIDFSDPVNNHLKLHAKQRRTIIESTPGFAENIVGDFPYESVGMKRLPKTA